jgi:tetratricopeptide (TPR) repeat protein
MIGAVVARAFAGMINPRAGEIAEAESLARRGLTLHEQRRIDEAERAFRNAIDKYEQLGRRDDAAPVYASLGKLLFDVGRLDDSEGALIQARGLYARRTDGGVVLSAINSLLEMIGERRAVSSSPEMYTDERYPFSFVVPPGWVRQRLVPQFSSTGGRVAVSHTTHALQRVCGAA